jgi:hypothetical protein
MWGKKLGSYLATKTFYSTKFNGNKCPTNLSQFHKKMNYYLFLEHFTAIVYYSIGTISVHYFQIDVVNRILFYKNSLMNTDSTTISRGGSAAHSV